MLLVGVQVERKPEARLELPRVGAAIVAVADVVVNVDAAFSDRLGIGLSRECSLRVRVQTVQRRHHIGGSHVVQVGGILLQIPAHTEGPNEAVAAVPAAVTSKVNCGLMFNASAAVNLMSLYLRPVFSV